MVVTNHQWHEWESPVSQNNYVRSYPLAINDGQRNVQSQYYNCPIGNDDNSSALGWDNLDVSDDCIGDACRDEDTYQILKDATHHMGETAPPLSVGEVAPPREDPSDLVGNVPLNFPESFFANPFAVSFPGDIPCPGAPSSQFMPGCTSISIPSPCDLSTKSSPMTPDIGFCGAPDANNSIRTPKSMACTPSSAPDARLSSKGVASATTKYGPQIHFVDMADKKGAQRIRNTINSRKHRQNKLDKIRELEKKLATIEAEKKRWQGRATEMGWKPSQ
ncbi:hypothetical protein Z517_04986 [Fonsecaea pedrosoi CBS 271.37]|uniref:Unplaced genomic scaffold supercont1.3, whole genome shotgun sequence n=1 Tax=Fonsecaea pedrosoi CBS 271.37 TaxID=1442368 RepID=A0A0D2GTU1_9EURO|nr:uncharacterized protein Z517_04986 [Fonsecaea pedrosoi CBS 271.37]KIW81960.1 hypothetical protein Z517_04986 [Fonsecaea pedrosoi CBS 271.37]